MIIGPISVSVPVAHPCYCVASCVFDDVGLVTYYHFYPTPSRCSLPPEQHDHAAAKSAAVEWFKDNVVADDDPLKFIVKLMLKYHLHPGEVLRAFVESKS